MGTLYFVESHADIVAHERATLALIRRAAEGVVTSSETRDALVAALFALWALETYGDKVGDEILWNTARGVRLGLQHTVCETPTGACSVDCVSLDWGDFANMLVPGGRVYATVMRSRLFPRVHRGLEACGLCLPPFTDGETWGKLQSHVGSVYAVLRHNVHQALRMDAFRYKQLKDAHRRLEGRVDECIRRARAVPSR